MAHSSPVQQLTLSQPSLSPTDLFTRLADQCSSLGVTRQDVYGDFPPSSPGAGTNSSWLRDFEIEVSGRMGKEAALFVPSGVMAQQISLLVHQQSSPLSDPTSFLCHHSSHLLLHEHDAYTELLRMRAVVIPPDDSRIQSPITFNGAKPFLEGSKQTFSMIVECPHREIGGKCTPFADLIRLSEYCHTNGIRFHMDGARLWEASAAYEKSLEEICSLFDSVYVSFYKGLGGMTGAMLFGSEAFIASCRVWLRRFGGNLYTQMPYAVSSWASFRMHVDAFPSRLRRLQCVVGVVTKALLKYSNFIRFDPPVPEVSMIHVYIHATPEIATQARDLAAEECRISCFNKLRSSKSYQEDSEVYTEFNMGPLNMEIPDEKWLLGWETFARILEGLQRENQLT